MIITTSGFTYTTSQASPKNLRTAESYTRASEKNHHLPNNDCNLLPIFPVRLCSISAFYLSPSTVEQHHVPRGLSGSSSTHGGGGQLRLSEHVGVRR